MQTEEREGDDGDEPAQVVDVLRYETSDGPEYRLIEAGRGATVVEAHVHELRRQRRVRAALGAVIAVVAGGWAALSGPWWAGVAVGALVLAAVGVGLRRGRRNQDRFVPEVVEEGATRYRAEERYDVVEE